jgi:two-component system, OmpR family, phosphate regulon response regulator OmpR
MKPAGRVLVVDDDSASRISLGWLLEDAGLEVAHAGSLAEGRERLAGEAAFDVVVLDVHLRDGTGTDLVDDVERGSPSAKIVVLSGAPTEPADSAHVVLSKGMDPLETLDRIRALIRR